MTPEERKAFADIADLAIRHPLVEQVIEEYTTNLRSSGVDAARGSLVRYGLIKCLNAAVQVARAQALDIDPSDLIMTDDEANAHMARMARAALEAGKPVIAIEPLMRSGEDEEDAP